MSITWDKPQKILVFLASVCSDKSFTHIVTLGSGGTSSTLRSRGSTGSGETGSSGNSSSTLQGAAHIHNTLNIMLLCQESVSEAEAWAAFDIRVTF